MHIKKAIAAGLISTAVVIAPLTMASADGLLSKVLTGAVGIEAVRLIAGPLNSFIDHVLLTNGVANQGKTKVVPILETGSSTYVGAAQVSGPADAVDQVQAVGALSFNWNGGVWKGSVLIPIDTLNPLKGYKRVYGVGVDAIVNARL